MKFGFHDFLVVFFKKGLTSLVHLDFLRAKEIHYNSLVTRFEPAEWKALAVILGQGTKDMMCFVYCLRMNVV